MYPTIPCFILAADKYKKYGWFNPPFTGQKEAGDCLNTEESGKNYTIINSKHSNIITNEKKKKSMDRDNWEDQLTGSCH